MESLIDGRKEISRSENTVIRPSGPWSPSVHKLLSYLHQNGFTAVPQPYGFDSQGNEVVSYIAGEVSNYPLSDSAASQTALITAAHLLRAYHDATIPFIDQNIQSQTWMFPAREPVEVICHGDFAPYNVVLNGRKAIAIIDFDTAHPGPRIWDIAYAIYRWAPMKNPNNPDTLGDLKAQIDRARLFCDTYNFPNEERHDLVNVMTERLETLIHFMKTEAAKGNLTFQSHLDQGHHLSYQQDILYLKENQYQIEPKLTRH